MAKGFKGGFPGGGNMNQLMKQAQAMQRQIAEAQEQAALLKGEAEAGGGMVKALVNGDHQIESLEIQQAVVDPEDIEMLQDLIIAAVNGAMSDLDGKVEDTMGKVTGGLGGLGGFGF